MEIQTIYTKERLLKFTTAVMQSRKVLWITLIVCNVLMVSCLGLLMVMGEVSDVTVFGALVLLVMDVTLLFTAFVLPRLTVSQSKNLNLMITYTFLQDEMHIEAKSEYVDESVTVKYAFLIKVLKKDTELYLFITHRQAYIVDLSALSEVEQQELKELLQPKISVKAFKWA